MTPLKTILYSTFTLLLLNACSNAPEQQAQSETIIDNKIDTVAEAKKSVEKINEKTVQTAVQIDLVTEQDSGSSLYARKCASCHGKDAKKSALNASAVIAGWSSQKTQDALNGYKNGSFGGKMKGIMEGQSKPLTEAEIKLISDFISVL